MSTAAVASASGVPAAASNVSVSVRVRPLNDRERAGTASVVFKPLDGYAGHLLYEDGAKTQTYAYDHVFDDTSSTRHLFDSVARDLVRGVVEGYNGTMFAYGQTAAGKTYTMLGNKDNPGILPLAVNEIMAAIAHTPHRAFLIRCSYIEIYNEVVTDLLSADGKATLAIREHPQRGFFVEAAEEVISTADDIMACLARGEKHRHVGTTDMNKRSSRSHTLFRIVVESRPTADADGEPRSSEAFSGGIMMGTLNLVDLAGSESVRTTNAVGERQREAGNINKSLLCLSRVIKELARNSSAGKDAPQGHTSFRDSKLTRVLQPSLAGNTRLAVVCCISPSREFVDETRSTLLFASSAKDIKLECKVNEVMDDNAKLRRLEKELQETRKQLEMLKTVPTPAATVASASSMTASSVQGAAAVASEPLIAAMPTTAPAPPTAAPTVAIAQTVLMQQYERTIAQLRAQIFVGGAPAVSAEVSASAYDSLAEARGKSQKESARLAAKGRAKRHRETWCPSGVDAGPSVDFLALLKPKAKSSAVPDAAAAPINDTSASLMAVSEAAGGEEAEDSMSGDDSSALAVSTSAPVPAETGNTGQEDDDDVISFRPRATAKVARMHDAVDVYSGAAAGTPAAAHVAVTSVQASSIASTSVSPAPRNSPRDRELVRLRSLVNKLQNACSDKEDELNSLRSDLEFATQVNENTEGMVEALRDEVRAAEARHASALAQNVKDAAVIAALRDQVSVLHASRAQLQVQIEDALASEQQTRATTASDMLSLEERVAQAVACAHAAESQAAHLREQLKAAAADCETAVQHEAAARDAHSQAMTECILLRERVHELEHDSTKLTSQVVELQHAGQDGDAARKLLVMQLQDAQDAAAQAARDMEAAIAREDAIRKRAEGAEAQLLALQSAASSSASERDAATAELSAQLSALRDALSKCDLELAECRLARDDAQAAAEERDAELTTVRAAWTDAQDACDVTSEQLEQAKASHEEQVQALRAELASLTSVTAAQVMEATARTDLVNTQLAQLAILANTLASGLGGVASVVGLPVLASDQLDADAAHEWATRISSSTAAMSTSLSSLQAQFDAHVNASAEELASTRSANTERLAVLEESVHTQQLALQSSAAVNATLITSIQAACVALSSLAGMSSPSMSDSEDVSSSLAAAVSCTTALFSQMAAAADQATVDQERSTQSLAHVTGFISRLGSCDTADIDSVANVIVDAEGIMADVADDIGAALQSTCTWLRDVHEARRASEEAVEERVAEAVARADELSQNNKGLNAQLGELQAAVVTLTAARDELRASLDAGGSDASARLEHISQLQVALSAEIARADASNVELERLTSQLRENDAALTAATQLHAQLRQDADALQAELRAACSREETERERANRLSQVELQVSAFEAAANEACAASQAADAARHLMAEQVVQKELELTLLHGDLDAAEQREATIMAQLADARTRLQAAQDANARQETALAEKVAALQAALDSLTSMQAAKDMHERAAAEAAAHAMDADARARSAVNDAAALRVKLTDAAQREEHLRLECASLEATNGRFIAQTEAMQRRVMDLEARSAAQEDALRNATATSTAMESQLKARAEQTLSTIAEELRRARLQLTQYEAQLADMGDTLIDMKAELGDKTTQYEITTAEMVALRETYETLCTRFGALRDAAAADARARQAAEASRASALAELQACDARMETMSIQMVRAMEDNARLQERVAKLDATKLTDAQVKKMLQIKEANQKYKVLVPQLQARVTQLEAAASTTASTSSGRGEAATKLAEALAAAQADAAREAVRTASIHTQLEAELDEQRQAADQMRASLADARAELEHVRTTHASLQTLVDSLQRDSGRMSGACAALRSTLRALTEGEGMGATPVSEATPLYELVSIASGLLASTAARTQTAESTMRSMTAQQEAAAAQMLARYQQLQSSSTALQAELDAKTAAAAGLQAQVDALRSQLLTAMDHRAELEQQLDAASEKLASLEVASSTAAQKLALAAREAALAGEEHTRAMAMLEKENLALMLELRTLRTAAATATARMSVSSGRGLSANAAGSGAPPAQPAPVNSAAPTSKPLVGRASIIRANMTSLPAPRNSVAKREPLGALPASSISNLPVASAAPAPAAMCPPATIVAPAAASMDLDNAPLPKSAMAAPVDVFAQMAVPAGTTTDGADAMNDVSECKQQ